MHKIACRVEYKGQAYAGWQFQSHSISVQEKVENALSLVADEKISVICAGRTDARVHATNQIIHFETNVVRSDYSWLMGANANLPKDISITWLKPLAGDFHARFSAISRTYRYIIHNAQARSALFHEMVTLYHERLDVELMKQGANYLLGQHDFSSFRASKCQAKSPIKTISKLDLNRKGDFIYLDISANAFLHHMVRNIVGVLVAIGRQEKVPSWVKAVLDYKDREKGGVTAPPYGLYLVGVQYPEQFEVPINKVLPQFN